MIKKFFSIIGVFALVCFSFYYTSLATTIIKNNDPIMKQIIKVSENYKEQPINAILVNNNITPGISGLEVDVDRSYESMKKYGSFNENLMVFKSLTPSSFNNSCFHSLRLNGGFARIKSAFKVGCWSSRNELA